MLKKLYNLVGLGKPHKRERVMPESASVSGSVSPRPAGTPRAPSYSRVFRWRLPAGYTDAPTTVEVVGTFTNWRKVPLKRDGVLDAWHTTVHHIASHRTHHYMLLVDGEPTYDESSDGLAVAHGAEEEKYQLQTDKGLRLLMLFAQTK